VRFFTEDPAVLAFSTSESAPSILSMKPLPVPPPFRFFGA
jgi:hypothetical protein